MQKKKKCGNRKLGNLGSFSSPLSNPCIILAGAPSFTSDTQPVINTKLSSHELSRFL